MQSYAHKFAHVANGVLDLGKPGGEKEVKMAQIEGRKATNLSLDPALVAQARQSGVNLSRAAEDGIRAALRSSAAQEWAEANRAALESSNGYVVSKGLPLRGYRMF